MKTKTSCISICLLLIFAFPLVSQSQVVIPDKKPVRWGVKGGLTFGDYYDAPVDFAIDDNFMAGGFVNFRIPALLFSLQAEVLYARKGVARFNREIYVDYIEVPLLAKMQLVTAGSIELNGYGGPLVGFPLEAKEKLQQFPDRELTANTDYGGALGIEVLLPIGRNFIVFDGRYALGLNNVVQEFSGKNSVFSFGVGLSF